MQSSLSRRSLLRIAAGGAAAAAVLPRSTYVRAQSSRPIPSSRLTPFVDELPRLPKLAGADVDLSATNAMHKFHRDLPATPTFAYGGASYLGPVIEARRGVTTRVTFNNLLRDHVLTSSVDPSCDGVSAEDKTAPRSVLYLHGGVTPPQSSGHPRATILPGGSAEYVFPNQQEAAGLWYYDRSLGIAGLNRYAGLAGMYLVRDEWDTGLADNPLALPAGDYEVPLVLMERSFNADGTLRASGVAGSRDESGSVGVVNGVIWPELVVDRGPYRFRIVNAGSTGVWNLYFSDEMTFWVIGGDRGLFNAAVPTKEVRVAPGERVDIVVDFEPFLQEQTVTLCNRGTGQSGTAAVPYFCRFRTRGADRRRTGVPVVLRGIPETPARLELPGRPTLVRNLTIGQLADGSRCSSAHALNNMAFQTDQIETPKQGAVERWNLINVTPDAQAIHLGLVSFHVLGSQALDTKAYLAANPAPSLGTRWAPAPDAHLLGSSVPPAEYVAGMKDTVLVEANTVTSIVIRWPTAARLGFDPDEAYLPSHNRGGHGQDAIRGYVWQLSDHERDDAMLPFRLAIAEAAMSVRDGGVAQQDAGGEPAPVKGVDSGAGPVMEQDRLSAEGCSVGPDASRKPFPWLGLAALGAARWASRRESGKPSVEPETKP